jgi:hypothetical protein
MLRLSTPDFKRILHADSFNVTYGGENCRWYLVLRQAQNLVYLLSVQ